MVLYVDSADRAKVETLLATGLFAGVTTNPTLLARAGLGQADLPAVYEWATAAGANVVYMQTVGTTVEQILVSGRQLRSIASTVIVKIPATRAGFAATRILSSEGIPVLVTAVYHATQALLADSAGAHSIAPYVGRMTDHGRPGVTETLAMRAILTGSATRILAASLRTTTDVSELAAGGVDDFTISTELLETMLADALTESAAAEFEAVAASRSGHQEA
jgi:TalC/MipB family fructose-6-phosphate aldolase